METPNGSIRDVRAKVLSQHEELRLRLRDLDEEAAPSGAPLATLFLRVSLLRLSVLFESHLRFEELHLAPRLRALDAWGAAREEAMLDEHREQRALLRRVCAAAEHEPCAASELAHEASLLVVTLLEDMAREDRELAELVVLEEGAPDQMTG